MASQKPSAECPSQMPALKGLAGCSRPEELRYLGRISRVLYRLLRSWGSPHPEVVNGPRPQEVGWPPEADSSPLRSAERGSVHTLACPAPCAFPPRVRITMGPLGTHNKAIYSARTNTASSIHPSTFIETWVMSELN